MIAITEKGGKRSSKAIVSTHPKYSQARIYTTYALVSMKKGSVYGLNCKMLE